MTPMLFLGYDSKPEISRETLYEGPRLISSTKIVEVVSWEDLAVSEAG